MKVATWENRKQKRLLKRDVTAKRRFKFVDVEPESEVVKNCMKTRLRNCNNF